MRLRKDPLAQEKLNLSKFTVSKFPFQLNENTTIELAMGKGKMLTILAEQNPNNFYLGIEKEATVMLKALKRAEKLNLNNFKIINKNIAELPDVLNGKVNELWLTFPDPWPKKRHFKRRLISDSFLKIYQNLLTMNGIFKFKTDNLKLFNEGIERLLTNNWTIIFQTNDLHNDLKNETNVLTDYEIKWKNQGLKINYLEAEYKA